MADFCSIFVVISLTSQIFAYLWRFMPSFHYIMNNNYLNLHIRLLFDGIRQYFVLFLQF